MIIERCTWHCTYSLYLYVFEICIVFMYLVLGNHGLRLHFTLRSLSLEFQGPMDYKLGGILLLALLHTWKFHGRTMFALIGSIFWNFFHNPLNLSNMGSTNSCNVNLYFPSLTQTHYESTSFIKNSHYSATMLYPSFNRYDPVSLNEHIYNLT